MKIKNSPTVGLLFLSIAYITLCCLVFFSLALIGIKLVISHEVSISRTNIEHVLVASVIAGVASGSGAWIFAKIDEHKARKSLPPDSE